VEERVEDSFEDDLRVGKFFSLRQRAAVVD